ncbi:MAG: M24 family metallopeptidase, partial [Bacilli bacterium]
DMITLDFGIMYQGYCSDMTRTFVVGTTCNPQLEIIYNIVKEAQEKAIKAIKPGLIACDIDKVARDYITEAGYGSYFGHGLGHSFGLEIHEYPYINQKAQTILEPNMIITIEPGIYIEGLGGVRIEDDILVTSDGYEILNQSPKQLIKVNNY